MYDVSNPSNPQLKTHWDENNVAVEGQDCVDNLLVVIAIKTGVLYTFDVSNPFELVKLGSLKLDIGFARLAEDSMDILQNINLPLFDALHTKIYTQSRKKYAMVTSPITTRLIAVDVTNPENPQQVSSLLTGIGMIESVYLKDHYAFCGGFWSHYFAVIDLSNLHKMETKKALLEDYYLQMVSKIDESNPNVLYASCWGDKGGLASFDVSDPENTRELSHVINSDLGKSNRVKIKGNYAYMPLEQNPGGVGIIDISNPSKLEYVKAVTGIKNVEKPYALAIKDDYLYIFGTKNHSMAIMQIIGG